MNRVIVGLKRVLRLLTALPIVTASCATAPPIVQVDADGPNVTRTADGMEIMSLEEGGLRIATAFAFQQEQMIALRVEVENLGADTVVVDPGQMYYRTCPLFHSGPNDFDCTGAAPVLTQEQVLGERERARARERANEAVAVAVGTALVLLTVVAVARLAGSGRGRGRAGGGGVLILHHDDGGPSDRERAATARDIDRQNLATQALHTTPLPSGRGVAGLVYIPVDPAARSLRLFMRIAGQRFRFPFLQGVRSARSRQYPGQ